MGWPHYQEWLDWAAGQQWVGLTAELPTKATASNKVRVGTTLVETDGKKSWIVTAVDEESGTITKQQTGAWS